MVGHRRAYNRGVHTLNIVLPNGVQSNPRREEIWSIQRLIGALPRSCTAATYQDNRSGIYSPYVFRQVTASVVFDLAHCPACRGFLSTILLLYSTDHTTAA